MKTVLKFFGLLLLALLVSLMLSYPVMLLWNYCLMPAVNILEPVTWLQAWGIMILCSLFFRSGAYYKE